MPKTDTEARAQLAALGLNPDAPALDTPVVLEPTVTTGTQPVIAPEGVDPRSMPISDIVFDPALLDGFPDLTGENFANASRHVSSFYKSRGRNKDRNRRLHDEVGLFIIRTKRSRKTPGTPHVKDAIRKGKKQTDLLALLAEHGITSIDDLAGLLGGGE